jgi:hypothetical protein
MQIHEGDGTAQAGKRLLTRLWLAAWILVVVTAGLLVAGFAASRSGPRTSCTATLKAAEASDWPPGERARDWDNRSDDPATAPLGELLLDRPGDTTDRAVGPFVVRWSPEKSESEGVKRRFDPSVLVEIGVPLPCESEPLLLLAPPGSRLFFSGDETRGIYKVVYCSNPFSSSPDPRLQSSPYGIRRITTMARRDLCPASAERGHRYDAAVQRFRLGAPAQRPRSILYAGAVLLALALAGLGRARGYFGANGIAHLHEGRSDGLDRIAPDDQSPPLLWSESDRIGGPVLFSVGPAAPAASFREAGLRQATAVVRGTRAEVEQRYRRILLPAVVAGGIAACLAASALLGYLVTAMRVGG